MGAWGELAFDNDTANDWAYGLDDVDDLSLVESAFDELEAVGDEYLDLFHMAAASAFHLAEAQAFLDGNERTGLNAAIDGWLVRDPNMQLADAMLGLATGDMDKDGLASLLQSLSEPLGDDS